MTVVDDTLGPLLSELKIKCGWPKKGDPTLESIEAYTAGLKAIIHIQNEGIIPVLNRIYSPTPT